MAFISSAANIGGAFIQQGAINDAAGTQAGAARHAEDLQYQMYQQQREDQQPWREAGTQALSQMQDPYFQKNFSMSDFNEDPGYQFRMQQGQQALEASAAARGGLMGGNFGTALTQYGQNFASNEYQNAYNRFTNNQNQRYGRLTTLAGMGQNATNSMGAASQNYANNAGNIMMNNGNAQAQAQLSGGQLWAGTLNNVAGNIHGQQQMDQLMGSQPNGGYGGGSQGASNEQFMNTDHTLNYQGQSGGLLSSLAGA